MPKKVDHKERRLAFTEAAIEVIAERGLDALRLVDVARAAGVTTGSLTHYFNDKDQLVAAALDHVIAESIRQIAETQGDLIATLAVFLPLEGRSQRAARVWLAFFGRSIGNETLTEVHRHYYEEFHRTLVDRLRLSEPQIAPENRAPVADIIIALIDGILVRATLDPAGWPADRQMEHMRLALAPLLARPVEREKETTS